MLGSGDLEEHQGAAGRGRVQHLVDDRPHEQDAKTIHGANNPHEQDCSDEMRQVGTQMCQQPVQLSHRAPMAAENIAPILMECG